MTTPTSTPRLRPVIRVFVSSTFSDMKHERNALAAEVYPKLEDLCQKNGFQFQAIDLRWGVSTEAGLDHRTMRICFDELRRAQEISPKPNFLILLGDRYGWRPLPEEISVKEFEDLERVATTNFTNGTNGEDKGVQGLNPLAVLKAWYLRDDNSVPSVYVLQSRRQDLRDGKDYTQDAAWRTVQDVLWGIINRAVPATDLQGRFVGPLDSIPPSVRFQASATEQEIWQGALRVDDAREHVLAFFRDIKNLDEFSREPDVIKDYVNLTVFHEFDAPLAAEQGRLKAALADRLDKDNVFRPAVPVSLTLLPDETGKRKADITTEHLGGMCADIKGRLTEIIEAQISEYWRSSENQPAERATRELEIEQLEHARVGEERGGEKAFVGRKTELEAIRTYLIGNSPWPLVVYGASGCGKTALLARAVAEARKGEDGWKNAEVIARFIGVTPRASDLRRLLTNLCQELRQSFPRDGALPTEIKELRDEFAQHLQSATPEQPLILFLDALDQLSDVDNGCLLNWIPLGQLPPHVKLIVSCLSDRAKDDPAGQPFSELTRRQLIEKNSINLDALSEVEARTLLFDRWLRQAGRTVSGDQRERIEQRLASWICCRQPIYLKLLFEEVRLWRSYDRLVRLGEDVPAILKQLFDRLSKPANHGPLLVERVLGYLSASRNGLAENEILEILFADPEYRKELVNATLTNHHELLASATRIPIAVWSQLRFDLAPYLTERATIGANVLTFYHRQVSEWVQERFAKSSDQSRQLHQRLADYFSFCCKPSGSHYLPQKRAIGEVAYHYRISHDKKCLCDIYSNISYYCSYVKFHSAYTLKEEMQSVQDSFIDDELRSFIDNAVMLLAKYPDQAPQLMYKELTTVDYKRQAESLVLRPWIRVDRVPFENEIKTEGGGITPVKTLPMWIQASCVAENAGVAFICNSENKIELLRIDDLKPCGEIPLLKQNSKTINKLLCDKTGKLLTLIYDNGEIIVLKTSFGLSGFIHTTSCVHRDVCQTGKFGAISAFAWPDGIVYQTRNRDVIRIQIENSGQIITSSLASENRVLMTCNFCNIPLLIWRNVKDYSITFPDIGGSVRADFRPLAVCRNGSRLAIATEEGKLLIYQWPDLVLVKEIVCRHPVISICRNAQDMFLMTDRHGNLLSLDRTLQLIDSGPCSRDQFDEYPSAIFTTEKGAFYISNSKCVTLSLRAAPRRDVMSVNELDGRRCILTYSRGNGFSVIIGSEYSRPLNQSIVGKRYESEFVKFKFAWDGMRWTQNPGHEVAKTKL